MTTKKDFIAAAKKISSITDENEKRKVAENFCTIFKNQNPRFDSVKFLKACNIHE
jgi:GMP synthase PP-ATPase subunit